MTLRRSCARWRRTSTWAALLPHRGRHAPVTKVNVGSRSSSSASNALVANAPLPTGARICATTCSSSRVAVAQHAVRERGLRVQRRASAARRSCCRAGSAACAPPTRRSARRSARLRREDVPAGRARRAQGSDRRHPRGVRRAREAARRGCRDTTRAQALEQARDDGREGRLSGHVARLLELDVQEGPFVLNDRSARTRSSGSARCNRPGTAGGHDRVGASRCRR